MRKVAEGVYESNYLVTSVVLSISDDAGQVYAETVYLPYRVFSDFVQLDLQTLFPQGAQALTAGKTYRATAVAYTTSGDSCQVLDGVLFTYE